MTGGAAMGGTCSLARELLSSWEDGRIKLYVTYKSLHYRRDHRELFESGDYVPLDAVGPRRDHVCAFARRLGGLWAIVAVPRLVARLQAEGARGVPGVCGHQGSGGIPAHCCWLAGQRPEPQLQPQSDAWTGLKSGLPPLRPPLGEATWGETALVLPECAPTEWRNVLTGEILPGPNAGADAPDGTPRHAQAAAAANLLRLADAFREFPVVLLTGER